MRRWIASVFVGLAIVAVVVGLDALNGVLHPEYAETWPYAVEASR